MIHDTHRIVKEYCIQLRGTASQTKMENINTEKKMI